MKEEEEGVLGNFRHTASGVASSSSLSSLSGASRISINDGSYQGNLTHGTVTGTTTNFGHLYGADPAYFGMDLDGLKKKLSELEDMVNFMKRRVAEFEDDNTKYKPRTLGKKN